MSFDTQILKLDTPDEEQKALELASELIRQGQLVAFPTETVYGLGANALDPSAVHKIFEAKGRPSDNPLIVHINRFEEALPLVRGGLEKAKSLAERFWPGPLTVILPKSDQVPDAVTAGLDTVAIRMPAHPVARKLIRKCRLPVAAPSANLSGRPSPTTARHVWLDMQGRIPLILDGGKAEVGVESTVLDLSREIPVILRPGGITREMLQAIYPEVKVDPSVMKPLETGQKVLSPGMKYIHYSPNAQVIIIDGCPDKVIEKINTMYQDLIFSGKKVGIMASVENATAYGNKNIRIMGERRHPASIAANLFDCFRELDSRQVDIILAEGVPAVDMGLAVMNRMGRAAGFHIIEV